MVGLDAAELGERGPDDLVVRGKQVSVARRAELLQQARRPLDIREQKGDRPGR